MATGTCATCGQEDIHLLFRKFLRDHLTDAKDPYSERCPGKTPVSLPPPRQPGPKRQPSAHRERGSGADQAQQIARILSKPLQEAGASRVLLDRLESADDERPTEDEFTAAVAALDALDKAGQRALRVEQSYLRKALFKGATALCDLCGRVFEVEFLVAAHVKRRADCNDQEKRDVAHVVMSACRFGCDELYERGYIAVGDDGQVILSHAIEASEHARSYAAQHLKGKFFGRPMTGRADYFTWHRENKFLDAV